MLQILENNEVLRMTIQDPEKDLDVIRYLFPHSVIEIDVCGENLIAIVKADTTIN